MLDSVASLGTAIGGDAGHSKNKMKDAAQQFESLMIAQLLKSAHSDEADGGGWLGTGSDQTGQTAVDFAEQQFATMLSKSGGIGLTRFIEQGLEKK